MKPIVVLYATREGHTRRVAERITKVLWDFGHSVDVLHISCLDAQFDLTRYRGAVIAASVHIGRFEPEVVSFVKRHRAALEDIPTVFVSVSLTEARAEDATVSAADRAHASADVTRCIEEFVEETRWRPTRFKPIAGALPYSMLGRVDRPIAKWIARHQGAPTDTAHDYVMTDWAALDVFARELASMFVTGQPSAGSMSAGARAAR